MKKIPALLVTVILIVLTLSITNFVAPTYSSLGHSDNGNYPAVSQASYYNGTKAVDYGLMVHTDYIHKAYYPAGINQSILQKNLDYFNSEDCAHFVSESLIAGGLTVLASNPPGDNLTSYDQGYFGNGSYGIVGVYRLADWLAGYDLPIFPNNATDEQTIGYYPIPASYAGSPQATMFYVFNYTMFPSYFLSPGDVVMDGGAGGGHAMLYIGNGQVVQTDPAAIWNYSPAVDNNITFYGILSYFGKNVSSLYVHIPTFGEKSVRISVLNDNTNITGNLSAVKAGEKLTFIGSFPNGVGEGNYTYQWIVNGKSISNSQFFNLTTSPGTYNIEVVSTGSTGSVNTSMSFTIGGSSTTTTILVVGLVIVVAAVSAIFLFKRRK